MNKIPKKNKLDLPQSGTVKLNKSTFKEIKEKLKPDEHIVFSFESLDFSNEYFALNGTCANWNFTMVEMLKEISAKKKAELHKYSTFRFHDHDSSKAKFKPPYNIQPDEFYQLRFGTSNGGIHGVFVGNIFYLIWLDPMHNMYPDDKFGGLKLIIPPGTCCHNYGEIIKNLNTQVEQLKSEVQTWEEIISEEIASENER